MISSKFNYGKRKRGRGSADDLYDKNHMLDLLPIKRGVPFSKFTTTQMI
jgi:hypothetical protein